jgi:DedD protein
VAHDDYYYEIQLTNKQLVFYFLAGATGLVLSFLAGVMVGRGVDQTASAAEAAQVSRALPEDRIVTEEPPATRPAPPAAEDLTYAQRLESDKGDNSLSSAPASDAGSEASGPAKAVAPPVSAAAKPPASVAAKPAPPATVAAKPPTTLPRTPPTTLAAAKAATTVPPGAFTIQVGAFKDRATADSMVGKLKAKGFAAYVMTPAGGNAQLFNVRVGSFTARPDAERVQARLRDEEKFKPFIVRN